jgi:hypothetical protein
MFREHPIIQSIRRDVGSMTWTASDVKVAPPRPIDRKTMTNDERPVSKTDAQKRTLTHALPTKHQIQTDAPNRQTIHLDSAHDRNDGNALANQM